MTASCSLFADIDPRGQSDVVQVQALYCYQGQFLGHGHRFGFLHQSDDQVIGHALLVMAEERVSTGGKLRFFHQFDQVFDRSGAELLEGGAADTA